MSKLKGKTVVVTGTLEGMGRAEAERRLKAAGAKVSGSVSDKTDLLFAGAGPGSKLSAAKLRGIPVLDEAALLAALEGKDLDVVVKGVAAVAAAKQAPPLPDAALAKFTALPLEKPDEATWKKITELLDQCGEEAAAVAVDYLLEATAGWDGELRVGERSGRDEKLEVRVAPVSWVTELLQGQEHPKLRLARVLDLSRLKLTGAVANHVFDCPSLSSVRLLRLGHLKLPGSFYAKLCDEDVFKSLTHLDLTWAGLGRAHAQAFAKAKSLLEVTHLGAGRVDFDEEASIETLLGASMWASLRSVDCSDLTVRRQSTGAALRALARNEAVNALRSYSDTPAQGARADVAALLARNAATLEDLSFMRAGPGIELAEALAQAGLAKLARLQLGEVAGEAQAVHDLVAAVGSGLEELGLVHVGAQDGVADALVAAAPKRLRVLALANDPISDEAMARLFASPCMDAVRELNLAVTGFGPLAVEALCARSHPFLEKLSLYRTKVDPEGIARICSAETLPALRVLVTEHPIPQAARMKITKQWW
ncbi:MAG: hypothetical protein QM765_36255 [Myxococcales bacterium]